MKKILLFAICFVQCATAFSQTLNGPESIEWDEANTRWLIGNKGNGTILARSENGTLTNFVTGIASGPYGIEILGDVLYSCEGGIVRGYNLANGANVFTLNVGGTFLNGLTSDNNHFLYATDFTAKKIFKIDVNAVSFTTIATGLAKTPNGIIFDGANNRCVYVTWGTNAPIMAIDMSSYAISTVLATTLSNCDGITRNGCGDYYVSSWGNNRLNKFDASLTGTHTVGQTIMNSPADLDCRFAVISDDAVTDYIANTNANNTLNFTGVDRPNPVITYNSNILTTTAPYQSYQWYLDGSPIVNATNQTYTPTVNGTYHCFIFYNTCEADSNMIEITSLANTAFEANQGGIKLFPNPSSDFINVSLNGNSEGNYTIINTLGQTVLTGNSTNENEFKISIADLKAGHYILQMNIDGKIQQVKFLKN